MAKVSPYHTISEEKFPRYHDNNNCPDGKRIEDKNKRSGKDGRDFCEECEKIS